MNANPNVDYNLLFKLAEQAVRMRALQHKYFKDRTQTNRIDAIKAEGVLAIALGGALSLILILAAAIARRWWIR